jgi:excisionase family DNA binding protein
MSNPDLVTTIQALTEAVRQMRIEIRDRPLIGALNTDQAAKYLGIHRRTLERLAESDGITSRKIGGSRRWRRQDLDDYLDRCSDTRGPIHDEATLAKRINEITGE